MNIFVRLNNNFHSRFVAQMEESRRGEEAGKKESNALENRGQRSLQQTQSLPQLQPGGTTQTDR